LLRLAHLLPTHRHLLASHWHLLLVLLLGILLLHSHLLILRHSLWHSLKTLLLHHRITIALLHHRITSLHWHTSLRLIFLIIRVKFALKSYSSGRFSLILEINVDSPFFILKSAYCNRTLANQFISAHGVNIMALYIHYSFCCDSKCKFLACPVRIFSHIVSLLGLLFITSNLHCAFWIHFSKYFGIMS